MSEWPRFEVFLQAQEKSPHQHVGSVHAPDAELALLNARDVFVRRPSCVSLWIAPASAVLARTAQEIAEHPLPATDSPSFNPASFKVFLKLTQKGLHSYVGEVKASTAIDALKIAITTYAERAPLVWWVIPAEAVSCTGAEDIEALFSPATHKDYRDQSFFHTVAALHDIKTQSREQATDES
jgi:ring-1,2-phenylacetyl-CoA epoxidase subunit PaaB